MSGALPSCVVGARVDRVFAVAVVVAAVVVSGCGRKKEIKEQQRTSQAQPLSVPASASARPRSSRLPEDPVKARMASRQWDEHLKEEEEGRRLRYDRDRLEQHQKLLSTLEQTRQRYVGLKNEAQLNKIRASLKPTFSELRRSVQELDRHRNSSGAISDYEAIIALLEEGFPKAVSSSFGGDSRSLDALNSEFERHTQRVRSWLGRAAVQRDEGAD